MPLFSRIEGDPQKPALVFLHGFLGSVDDWNETVSHLKTHYYCVCLDLPGHGKSVSIQPPFQDGFNYCHQLIKNTLDILQIKKYSLIGYSLGGRIALDYARTQSDKRLQNLILESCHTGLQSSDEKTQRYQDDLCWAKRFATQSMLTSLSQWYEQAVFSDLSAYQKELFIEQRRQNYGVNLASMLLSTSLAQQSDALPFLHSHNRQLSPLSINYCFGEEDNKFKNIASKLSTQSDIKVTEFKGAGHNIHQSAPQSYAQYIMKHIPTDF